MLIPLLFLQYAQHTSTQAVVTADVWDRPYFATVIMTENIPFSPLGDEYKGLTWALCFKIVSLRAAEHHG